MEVKTNLIVGKIKRIIMKVKSRDVIIVASIKREIGLRSRVVKSKKIYTRKTKTSKGCQMKVVVNTQKSKEFLFIVIKVIKIVVKHKKY